VLVYGRDAFIAQWVLDLIPHGHSFGECVTIGVVSNDRLLAGIVYHDYRAHYGTIQLSMAAISPMWAKKKIIAGLLRYPFEQLDCFKVRTVMPIDNAKAIKVNAHVGFKREAILAHEFGKKRHAVIMRMLRPDYHKFYGATR
jgi:RimJ/RimL family protein N-acetyltransferase